jgi:tripartite-type tricarboxylate transporter receptor subunit TctC
MKKCVIAIAFTAALAAVTAGQAFAAWPEERPIEILVGFAPGGTTDIMARAMAPYIGKHLGVNAPPIVVNRPGASGEIAVSQLARAKPDGYTIGIVNLPGYFFVPMYRKASYDPKSLALIARAVSDPTVLVARKESKYNDLQQVAAALTSMPSSLSAGHNGVGTNGHLALLRLQKAAGVKLNAIPFNGSSQQKTALAGNHIDLAFLSASEVPDPEHEAVPFKILGQFAKKRVARLSSIPTTYDQGFEVEMTAERGFAGPAGLPPAIQDRLQKAIEAAMKDPDYIKSARGDGPFLDFLDGAEWTRRIESERKAYEELARGMPKE